MHFVKKKHSSYNVYLEKYKYIYGVNRFAIHKPGLRNYIHEWIFNDVCRGDSGPVRLELGLAGVCIAHVVVFVGVGLTLFVIETAYDLVMICVFF